jgi:hypothetical protein
LRPSIEHQVSGIRPAGIFYSLYASKLTNI